MIILIEGNEGVGKTTLINEISKKLPCVIVKYPKEVKNTFDMLKYFANSKTTFLLDRGFVSDIVYRIWDKQKGQMSLYQIGALLKDYEDYVQIIFCHNENGYENAMKRGEDFVTKKLDHDVIEINFDIVEQILKQFTNVDVYDYNYEYDSIEDVMKFIMGESYVD